MSDLPNAPDDVGRDLDAATVRAECARGHTQETRQGLLGVAGTGKFQIWWHCTLILQGDPSGRGQHFRHMIYFL